MKVVDHLARAAGPLISFEIIPPLRGGNIQSLLALMNDLVRYRPPFIDITSHAAEAIYEETHGGIQRRVKRKRPGTLGVCALIQNKYEIDAVPHVLCHGFTREETEDFLIELQATSASRTCWRCAATTAATRNRSPAGRVGQPLRRRPGAAGGGDEPRPLPGGGPARRRADELLHRRRRLSREALRGAESRNRRAPHQGKGRRRRRATS